MRRGCSREALPFQVFLSCGPPERDGRLAVGLWDIREGDSLPSIINPPSLVALRLRLITRLPRSSLFRRNPGPEFQAGFDGDFSSGSEVFFDFLLPINGPFRESMKGIFDLGILLEFLCLLCEGGDQVLVASASG